MHGLVADELQTYARMPREIDCKVSLKSIVNCNTPLSVGLARENIYMQLRLR